MKNQFQMMAVLVGLIASPLATADVTFYVLGGAGSASVDTEVKGFTQGGGFTAVRQTNDQRELAYVFGGGIALGKVSVELNKVAFGDTGNGYELDGYSIGMVLDMPFNDSWSLVQRADYYNMDYQFANGVKGDGNGLGVGLGLRYQLSALPVFTQAMYQYIRHEGGVDSLARGRVNSTIHYPSIQAGYRF